MNNLIKYGRTFFAIGVIALGILGIIAGDFLAGRPPAWSAAIGGKLVWAYVLDSLLIIAGLAVIFNIKGKLAAMVIGAMILLFSFLLRHLPPMISNTWENILWSINAWKTLALSGGAFIVAASFLNTSSSNDHLRINKILVSTGIIFLSLFMIISGCSHFKFDWFVKEFIPAYIPLRPFWTYFCGIALVAGGIGILIKRIRRLSALLSAIMILGWFILLHIPRFIAAPNDWSDRMGLCESLAISGVLLVLAGIHSKKIVTPV